MGPGNIVFDRLQLHSWCIPKPWTNSLPLQLVHSLLCLSLWDFKLQDVHSSFEWTKLCLNDERHSLNTHFLSASSIANASWWKDANVVGERALATFIIPQPRPSSHRGTSRRLLITSWTTLIQDIRGTLHWFHSRELLCMLSVVDKLYFKTFYNERSNSNSN